MYEPHKNKVNKNNEMLNQNSCKVFKNGYYLAGVVKKPVKTDNKANRYHSSMVNDRVQTYRMIASTMFNDGVINMGRVLVVSAFTGKMGQQYPTDAWEFSYIHHSNRNSE